MRLVTYNLQVGIETRHYRDYVMRAWQHVLPSRRRRPALAQLAHALSDFDVVALQEADGGSLRTRFENQVAYLAGAGGFPNWHQQLNRNLGRIGQHGNGFLCRPPVRVVEEHRLPGLRGRGALVTQLSQGGVDTTVMCVHLALSRRARARQLHYLAAQLHERPRIVVMGDFNCSSSSAEMRRFVSLSGLTLASGGMPTFPSWRPRIDFDHVLTSPDLDVRQVWVPPWRTSDHLPVAVEIAA